MNKDYVRSEAALHFQIKDRTIHLTHKTQAELLPSIQHAWARGQGFALATLNLDHLVKLNQNSQFREAYCAQDFVVADGNPIVWLAKLAKQPVELVPGSDLILPLCWAAAHADIPLCLIGATPEALAGAAQYLRQAVPNLTIALTIAPPMGFDPIGAEARQILAKVAELGPCLCLLALGAPKQEIFAALGRDLAPQAGFASIGAGLDFLSGHQTRAPRWMRAMAMEWLFRLLHAPRRLLPRYLACFAILPHRVLAALAQRKG